MYFSSHAGLLVYLIACAFGLLCFIRCFLVKLYILLNRLISTVLPSCLYMNGRLDFFLWKQFIGNCLSIFWLDSKEANGLTHLVNRHLFCRECDDVWLCRSASVLSS